MFLFLPFTVVKKRKKKVTGVGEERAEENGGNQVNGG